MKIIRDAAAALAGFWLLAACSSEPAAPVADNVSLDEPIIDGAVAVDQTAPSKPSQEALRERAKTDPDGADAEAIDNMGRNEVIATAINSAGYLCARVTDAYPSSGAIVVTCVENRNGSGRVKYRVDANAGTVEPL